MRQGQHSSHTCIASSRPLKPVLACPDSSVSSRSEACLLRATRSEEREARCYPAFAIFKSTPINSTVFCSRRLAIRAGHQRDSDRAALISGTRWFCAANSCRHVIAVDCFAGSSASFRLFPNTASADAPSLAAASTSGRQLLTKHRVGFVYPPSPLDLFEEMVIPSCSDGIGCCCCVGKTQSTKRIFQGSKNLSFLSVCVSLPSTSPTLFASRFLRFSL